MFSIGLHHYFTKKIKKPTIEELVFANLSTSILDNIRGLLFSYISEDFLTVIQKIRIVYETYIIFQFLIKYRELIEPFFDHIKIIENKIFKDLPDYNEEIFINDMSNDFLSWTKKIIPNRNNRNLGFLAKELGIDKDMSFIYKLSSNFIHTNAYSIFNKTAIDRNYIRSYLPFMSDIMIRQIVTYLKAINKKDYESELISVLLNGLENIFFVEILNDSK